MQRRTLMKAALTAVTLTALQATTALAENTVLKIGFVGVTSGPAAAWGISNQRSMEARAHGSMRPAAIPSAEQPMTLKLCHLTTRKIPSARLRAWKKWPRKASTMLLVQTLMTAPQLCAPWLNPTGSCIFPMRFPKSLYQAPASNAVLGMVANYQSGPAIYKYLMDEKGVKTVAFIAANESDPLSQRDGGVEAATALGMEVVSANVTYQVDTTDFTPVLTPVMRSRPDLLVLSGVSPANAPQLIRSARELGFQGVISTETAQDAGVLAEGAGDLANGFISVGGASTPELASPMMNEFVQRYTDMFGEYNDESNTKVYALEYILETLKADPSAITDVDAFQATMDTFEAPNPYMNGDAKLRYVGMSSFGQKRQVSVPLVVNVYQDGEFETLFVAEVD